MSRAERRRQEKLKAAQGSVAQLDAKAHLNQGIAHYRAGRLEEAERVFNAIWAAQPQNHYALDFLSVVNNARARYARSIEFAKRAIAAAPDYIDAYVHLATPLITLGRYKDARNVLATALRRNSDYVPALVKLATVEMKLGDRLGALSAAKKAVRLDSKNVAAQVTYGDNLQAVRRFDRAEEHYRKALELQPKSAAVHHRLGLNAWASGEPDIAAKHIRESLILNPKNMMAHIDLFNIYEYAHAPAKMREVIDAAREIWPGNDNLKVLNAQLLRAAGDLAAARKEFESVEEEASLIPVVRRVRTLALAEILEQQEQYDKAFEYYVRNNALHTDSPGALVTDRDAFVAKLDASLGKFTPEWTKAWRKLTPENGRESPVFLVGFPRSGTTLLENFLRGHEQMAVLEEKPILNTAILALQQMPEGDPGALATLSSNDLVRLRRLYFDELEKFLDPSDQSKTVIDKQPMNMTRGGVLHRMFPDAKFLFMERLPHDCVLSAYTKTFLLNAMSANFLDLHRTAMVYDKSMTLWREITESLPMNVFSLKYEALVEEPELHLHKLFEFLGQEWRPEVLDHATTARQRDNITSASRNQVTQELYMSSRGRWRRFENQLEPVRPILDKWAERLGYKI